MHFFYPIQQSASQIYHSALPLSPKSLTFHSGTLDGKTRVTGFYGRPDTWGVVVRTITASPKHFTFMTTFGHRIAAACDDGTVGIYDSITGVLRLSLSPADPVQAIRGSPDGSALFCAHKASSITVWDMQTGGLIYTFVLEWSAEDIAISLEGRYLACGLSDGSVRVWEVAKKMGDAVIRISPLVTHFCWLEPEGRLAVSRGVSVHIWDIVSGTVLRDFAIQHPAYRMVYSQKLEQLAIMASSTPESTITIANPQMNTPIVSHSIRENLSCLTFSQTTEELVCGMETHGLQVFNISTRGWRHIDYPDTMTHVSSLPNGTVVANFVDSGLKLLSLDEGYTPFQQPTLSALTVHAFDKGQIVAILSTDRDRLVLLDSATMSQLLTIPAQKTRDILANRAYVLCASLEDQVTVYCFEEGDRRCMQLWRLYGGDLVWTVEMDGLPSIGAISPEGQQIVTFRDAGDQTFICMWDAIDGQLKAQLKTGPIHPLDITFDSQTRFYSHHDTYRVAYDYRTNVISPPSWRQPSIEQSQRYYAVDDTNEWVIGGTKRVCWIPPGYIGSVQPSYCWAGHSLVIAGQDGMLRKLTFREPI
jgi:WD40 repeat protein